MEGERRKGRAEELCDGDGVMRRAVDVSWEAWNLGYF